MKKISSENSEINSVVDGQFGALDEIGLRKTRRYTLMTLGVMILAAMLVSVIAFMQGLLIRQVVNTTVALVMLICFCILYKNSAPLKWPTVVAVFGVHVIVTSGLVTNGGIAFYGAAMLPVVPMISALLLGVRVAAFSFGYVLLISLVSTGLQVYGFHPANITAQANQPMLALVLTCISIVVAFLAFNSLLISSRLSEKEVGAYTRKLEVEMCARTEAEWRAQEAAAAKNNFLAAISHELRTPLNSIIGFTRVLEAVDLPDRGKACTVQIGHSSEELLKKINDLLEFTEIVFDRVEISRASIVVDDLFMAIESSFSKRVAVTENFLDFEYELIKGQAVVTDGEKIKKIIDNIVDNALKYTQKGSVLVTGRIHKHEGKSYFLCDIKDEGIGIDETKMDQIFTVFTQQDMSISRAYEGIGLGLASSYNLTLLLEGNLSVKNNDDKGCTFSLKIPV
ncbi:hypothetical protein A9Q99_27450 [Gammaproteobacteria bacterium 45_16_T64]|nr:hypothetical protein A9Q99_27450 [Gammaproteobacteria bacterium 45_16_T64]